MCGEPIDLRLCAGVRVIAQAILPLKMPIIIACAWLSDMTPANMVQLSRGDEGGLSRRIAYRDQGVIE